MKFSLIFALCFLFAALYSTAAAELPPNDNEFAEFEVADEGPPISAPPADLPEEPPAAQAKETKQQQKPAHPEAVKSSEKQQQKKADDFEGEEEFAFLADEEEFEGFGDRADKDEAGLGGGKDSLQSNLDLGGDGKPSEAIKPLTFADIPSHFRSNWSSYQVEAIALLIICVYVLNYVYGKQRNHSIAHSWFLDNRHRLEKQFALVGDDGTSQEPEGGHLLKDTDYSYSIWSTGRVGCQGMLTSIRLCKRQDLLGLASGIVRPKQDRVVHKVDLDRNEMDSFVIIFGQRKSVVKTVKEMNDLSTYVTERKSSEKIVLPEAFVVFAEVAETIPSIIDASTLQFLKKCEKYVEFIHISDQFSGARPQDEQFTRLPETAPTMIFSYFLLGDEETENVNALLLNFTFFMLDKVRRYRLSREGKAKADKKRQSVEENFLKQTHMQRQEAAQNRREEKTRERKQRVMEEEDPERQRRLERLEQKRDAKQKAPKMKQFKIK